MVAPGDSASVESFLAQLPFGVSKQPNPMK